MEIKHKLYPYPVLSSSSTDYSSGKFDVTTDFVRDGYNLRIDFIATLTCKSLLDLIKNGQAQYVYHLECAQTGFRTVVQTNRAAVSYSLLSKSVNGKLQICSFIAAATDIPNYSSADFHDDYHGVSFDIEAGCVMAVGQMLSVDISKDIDDLANTPSIFSIVRNADASCQQMLVDMSGRKIVVKMPLNEYYSYKALSRTPQAQAILNSLTIIPALVYVLEELRSLRVDERQEHSDLMWYKTLSSTLAQQFDCNIESEEFNSQNFIELAQKLINNPLSDAFKMLTSSFENAGGDDE